MVRLTKNQALRKHAQTLRRRLAHVEGRGGGSYDDQEAAALKAAIDCLEEKGGASQQNEPDRSVNTKPA